MFIHTSCFLPLYPFADIPIVLVFHPNRSISPNDLFIHFEMPRNDAQSPSIRGVVIRKGLSVLPDSSYLFSISVENSRKEVIVQVDKSYSRYCQLYLPLGAEIVLSNYTQSFSLCFSFEPQIFSDRTHSFLHNFSSLLSIHYDS